MIRSLSRHTLNRSGQTLLIGALLFIVLMIMVPVMVYLNRTLSRAGTMSQTKQKGRSVAEEGIAFAVQQLSQPNQWPYPGGPGTAGLPVGGSIPSGQGGVFTLQYVQAPAPGLQNYQVGVLARSMDPTGNVIPGGSLYAHVSQRTVGVKLPTGYNAPAALELMQAPNFGALNLGQLTVEWGPLLCRDSVNALVLNSVNQASGRPRKFAAAGISPLCPIDTCAAPTDRLSYWAFVSPGFAPIIDTTVGGFYETIAKTGSACTPLACLGPCTGGSTLAANPLGSCYFDVPPGDTADMGSGYNYSALNSVIYIKGNASFGVIQIDVSGTGAVIVEGDLTLTDNLVPPNGFAGPTVVRPPTYRLDDPFTTCTGSPCNGVIDRYVDLHGFLYVTGNVTTVANADWTFLGTVRIDGLLTVADGSTVAVFFNDAVNHRIRTSNFELQIDSMTVVP